MYKLCINLSKKKKKTQKLRADYSSCCIELRALQTKMMIMYWSSLSSHLSMKSSINTYLFLSNILGVTKINRNLTVWKS